MDEGESVDLESLYNAIHTEPVEAVYDRTTGQVTQSKVGLSFDIKAAQQMLDAAKPGSSVFIPLIRTEPAVSTEQLQAMLFRDVLSVKATYVDGTSNRVHNVKLASQALDGTILNPGDVFSYNETLGERTREKGYKEAGAYVNGNVVQEVGGGICQGSSTLYYCVLYADLEVVERSNHMFTVGYLPLGHDATVNWGTVDFKFKNNTDYPVKIEALYKDRYLTIRLLGTKTNTNRVEIKYEVISTTEIKTVQKEDPAIEPGTTKVSQAGHKGYVVDTYKYIYDENDNLISKTYIRRSTYKMQEREVLVPVGTLTSPSPTADGGTSPSPTDNIPSVPAEPSELQPSPEPPQPSESADPPSD
jgi:vancomycin resistance protein YoaR